MLIFAACRVTGSLAARASDWTSNFTVDTIADTPSVTDAVTLANTQSTSGLVIDRNAVDGAEVTHFRISGITGGTLFQNDGSTQINDGDFITFAQANAGLIASVQKLSRPEGSDRLAEEQFDYVIMDEVHHAHAPSYRRVLARIRGDFVLGLTATPERTDGIDGASIFDDNLAYHASIGDGIAEESLVPFHYIGIKDTVDCVYCSMTDCCFRESS